MFSLTLLTPQKKMLVDEPVEEVFVPGFLGEMHILPGHAPLMTVMSTGVLRYRVAGEAMREVAVSWGYCEVSPKGVSVLAETAETPEEIDLERAKLAQGRAETNLTNLSLEAEVIAKNLKKLDRSRVRQDIGTH